MKKLLTIVAAVLMCIALQAQTTTVKDWARHYRYAQANAELTEAPKVVFMGNSITDNWGKFHPDWFKQHNFAARGIGGQTTNQMLCRFQADVIVLAPKAVVILAGTNDIAENMGETTLDYAMENIRSMCELARCHKIKVILCSVTPSAEFGWHKGLNPAPKIVALNAMIKDYAAKNKFAYVDYYSLMADENGALPKTLSGDGVHPYPDAYNIMEEAVLKVINKTVK